MQSEGLGPAILTFSTVYFSMASIPEVSKLGLLNKTAHGDPYQA